MAIEVVFSNQSERLLSALAERLHAERVVRGPFGASRVVVAHPFMGQYVARALAMRGSGFNVTTTEILPFFSEIGTRSLPGRRLVTADDLRGPLLSALSGGAETAPELLRVRRFLGQGGARLTKLGELSSLMADTFFEYEWWRPRMLEAWPREALGLGDDEAWQRALFLSVSKGGGLSRALHPYQLLARLRGRPPADEGPIHAFMLGALPPLALALFESVAVTHEVRFYDWNPSEEFWTDPSTEIPGLLTQLGGAVRTNVAARQKLVEWNTVTAFAEPKGATFLARVQSDVLHARHPSSHDTDVLDVDGAMAVDGSLAVFACPSPRREMDVAAREICQFVTTHAPVSLDDVGVILTGADWASYVPHVSAAFLSAGDIPFALATTRASRVSDSFVAFQKLLRLPLGKFERAEVLSLVTSPPFAAHLPGVSPAEVAEWCDELAIFGGRDRRDLEGTYVDRDVHTWDPGLRRLALGAVMSSDAGPFVQGADEYLPASLEASDAEGAMLFARLVRSLIEDARHAVSAEKTMVEWVKFLRALLLAYIQPSAPGELDHILALDQLLTALAPAGAEGEPIAYRAVFALVSLALARAASHGGGAGVLVGPPSLLAHLPLRMVVIVGLGTGRSPEAPDSGAAAPFDLRREESLTDDVSLDARERGALLEAVLSVRERGVLTYVGWDAATSEPLPVGPALSDILDGVRSLTGQSLSVTTEPAERHDAPASSAAIPEAMALAHTVELHEHLVREVGGEVPKPLLQRELELPGREALRLWLKLAPPLLGLPTVHTNEGQVTLVSLALLRQFLEQPAVAYARLAAGISHEEIPEAERDRLATSSRDEPELLRRAFTLLVSEHLPVREAYLRALDAVRAKGDPLYGLFGSAEQERHVALLSKLDEILAPYLPKGGPLALARLGPGAALSFDSTLVRIPPVSFDVEQKGAVSVVGQTGIVGLSPALSVSILARREIAKFDRAEGMGQLLRPFLDHVALAASGARDEERRAVIFATAGDSSPNVRTATFAPIEKGRAAAYLRDLATDLLSQPHSYFFPADAVFLSHCSTEPLGLRDAAALSKSKIHDRGASFSPIALEGFPLPHEAEALAMAERRFGLFWETLDLGGAR